MLKWTVFIPSLYKIVFENWQNSLVEKVAKLTVHASFPISPPAHMKLFLSRLKAGPSRVPLRMASHLSTSTSGTSTSLIIFWYWPSGSNLFFPQPVTQHLKSCKNKWQKSIGWLVEEFKTDHTFGRVQVELSADKPCWCSGGFRRWACFR